MASMCFETCSELLTYAVVNVVASDNHITIQTFAKIFETKHKQDHTNSTIKEEDPRDIAG